MNDYDGIVKALRCCANLGTDSCYTCPRCTGHGNAAVCSVQVKADAANAITHLRTDNTRLLNENAMLEKDNATLTAKLEQAEARLKNAVQCHEAWWKSAYGSLNKVNAERDNAIERAEQAESELKAYKDTGLNPQEFKESVDYTLELNKKIKQATGLTALDISELQSKLAEYEGAEKQGLKITLPCKVGDTIYFFDQFMDEIYKEKVDEIIVTKGGFTINCMDLTTDDFGKIVFLTEQTATDALKEGNT